MVQIGDKEFEVVIERKRIKNLYIKVEGNIIHVTCPKYVANFEINNFINEKRKWIYNTSLKRNEHSKLIINDSIYYKGRKYNCVILKGNKQVKIDEDTIYIRCRSGLIEDATRVYYDYGKKIIKQYALDNQEKYLEILRDYGYDKVPEYNVKTLKSMWGCCYSKKNTINLSTRLIHFDPICLEAIIWHELLHFIIPNHSKRYHQVLESHMPKYKEIIKKLS